jgi:hypothetical protein
VREVVLLTRPGCHLCEEALSRVRRVGPLLRRRVEVRDITSDPGLEEEYHDRIPVLLDGAGRVLAEGPMALGDVLRAVWRS